MLLLLFNCKHSKTNSHATDSTQTFNIFLLHEPIDANASANEHSCSHDSNHTHTPSQSRRKSNDQSSFKSPSHMRARARTCVEVDVEVAVVVAAFNRIVDSRVIGVGRLHEVGDQAA